VNADEAWLIDLDGTLIEADGAWGQAHRVVLPRFSLPVLSYHELSDAGKLNGAGTLGFIEAVLSHAGSSLDSQVVADQIYDEVAKAHREGFKMKPGAHKLLAHLNKEGIPAALVTAGPQRVVELFTSYVGDNVFSAVVTSDDVNFIKPAPDAYLLAMRMLGVSPGRCIAVEDSLAGITAARQAGCGCVVGVGDREEKMIASGADLVLASLEDLPL
jgi:HAD superfamily hydrolase (TIGR01509 family)